MGAAMENDHNKPVFSPKSSWNIVLYRVYACTFETHEIFEGKNG